MCSVCFSARVISKPNTTTLLLSGTANRCSVFARGGTTHAHIVGNTGYETSEETHYVASIAKPTSYAEAGILSFTTSIAVTSPYH
jgi:hypothetical protein